MEKKSSGRVMLEVRNLKTKYVTRFGESVYAVDGVSFKIEEAWDFGEGGGGYVKRRGKGYGGKHMTYIGSTHAIY